MDERVHRTPTPRKPFVGLAAVLFLILSLNSAPSVPDPLSAVDVPSPEEVRALEELADWLLGERGLEAMSPRALTAAIREQPRTFEIFRSYNPVEARRRYVVGLPYGEQIFAAARRHGLDSLLVASLVEAESSFLPRVVSPRGAVGLMQVMPVTERDVLERNPQLARGLLTDPDYNLRVGTTYLSYLLERFDGDLKLALAAYHMGPTKVAKAKQSDPGLTTDELIIKHAGPKTRAYVRNVLRVMGETHE